MKDKILYAIVVLLLVTSIWQGVNSFIKEKRIAKLEKQNSDQRKANIMYADSIATAKDQIIQKRVDSVVNALSTRKSIILNKTKKQDAKLYSIDSVNIFLPRL